MGNDSGFYIGPYLKVYCKSDSDFGDLYDRLYEMGNLKSKDTGDSDMAIFVPEDEFLGRRSDFIGWDDCGEYGMFLDVESEMQDFANQRREEITLLRSMDKITEVKWGVVVWGEF